MITTITVPATTRDPGTLPQQCTTRAGVVFSPRDDTWRFADGSIRVTLDFLQLDGSADTLRTSFKRSLLWYLENRSAMHARNLFHRFLHLDRYLQSSGFAPVNSITAAHLLSYRASLTSDVHWYLGTLSGLFSKWNRLGIDGIDKDAIELLGDLTIAGNQKGVAVATADPETGPFTDVEFQAIQAALDSAYADEEVSERDYILVWLLMALGARPRQYAAMKVKDVCAVSTGEATTYVLRVPRAKQRNSEVRTQFKSRPLIAHLGERLLDHANSVRQLFAGLLPDPDEAPLFPADSDRAVAPGFAYHLTANEISRIVAGVFGDLEVYSERTGRAMQASPIRFRRTLGTRAAEEGHGELVIAELLDHQDTQNVGVYIAATPEIAGRIDRAVAMDMAPLAQAFQGVLIEDESQATRAGDPTSRIRDLRIDESGAPMGSCGQHSFCGFNAPIACYTCKSFEPWLDGPHEAVLDHLLARREQLSATTDVRIASVNDRTILAVARVVQLVREQLKTGDAG